MSPLTRLGGVAIAVVVLGLLTGCGTGAADEPTTETTGVIVQNGSTPTPTPVATTEAAPADYLLAGTPLQPDADGEWSGHYGFWTDDSHAVACDLWIFSGDSGGVSCEVRADHASERTYALPAGITTTCSDAGNGNASDGSTISINYKIFADPTNVGFAGCLGDQAGNDDPALDAIRKVLPPNSILTVTQPGFETYRCSVADATASCSDSAPGSSFTFGLTKAYYHQG